MSKLRHVVMFAFKAGTPDQTIREIEEGFAALPGKIPGITGFEWGTDVSVEGKTQGYSHCFLVTFADEAARDAYLPHPAHQEFVQLVRQHVAGPALVFDYWSHEK
jgi:quinol monooxygenase YgiN